MMLARALNIRICQVEQKTVIMQIEIIRRDVKYEVHGINTKTFEWMYPDRWVVLYEAIDSAVRSGALQHGKDWRAKVRVGEWTRAFVKNDSARAKNMCKFLEMSNQKDYRNILVVRCSLHYTEDTDQLDRFDSYDETTQNEYVPVHHTNGHAKIPSYTPSVKTEPSLLAADESDEECYRPLPLSDTSNELISQTPAPPAPVYRAAPTESSKRKRKKNVTEAEKLVDSLSVEADSNRARKKASRAVYVSPKRAYRKKSETESATVQLPSKKACEQTNGSQQKTVISESVRAKTRELFGDDDDVDHAETAAGGNDNDTNVVSFKNPSQIDGQKHSKYKRKLKDIKTASNSHNDEKQENQDSKDDHKWLSKHSKKDTETSTNEIQKSTKLVKSKDRNDEPTSSETQQAVPTNTTTNNLIDINDLYNLTQPVPPEVDKLTLEEMSAKDILKTFDYYKPVLDAIFLKAKNKDYVRNWEGVNHFLVMNLTERSTQMELMEKLGQVYEPRTAGPSAYLTLFSNAMMPEWLVHLVMAKYKKTRDETLTHLQALEKHRLHVESQNNQHYYL